MKKTAIISMILLNISCANTSEKSGIQSERERDTKSEHQSKVHDLKDFPYVVYGYGAKAQVSVAGSLNLSSFVAHKAKTRNGFEESGKLDGHYVALGFTLGGLGADVTINSMEFHLKNKDDKISGVYCVDTKQPLSNKSLAGGIGISQFYFKNVLGTSWFMMEGGGLGLHASLNYGCMTIVGGNVIEGLK